METYTEKKIHTLFYLALSVKLVIAFLQILGGFISYLVTIGGNFFVNFIPAQPLLNVVKIITMEELTEDPRDFLANYLLHFAQTFSMDTLHFVAFYLMAHGLIKLWLIVGLLRRKLWYYPVSIAVFCMFMIYQLYRYTFTHSPFLILLTIIDFFVIWLTWREYKSLKG